MNIFRFFKPRQETPAPVMRSVQCENCGAQAEFLDSVDFNKSCEEGKGIFLPRTGEMIEYFLCDSCKFCFAPAFRSWKLEEFVEKIYNEDYVKVDPDYVLKRPTANATEFHEMFGAQKHVIRHLDYGGGSGLLSSKLRENGWDSQSFDPVADRDRDAGDLGMFNFVSAVEVFEHVPDINAMADQLAQLCSQDGLIMFATLCSDGHVERGKPLTWWYAAPRNGHISLFSEESLKQLFGKRGLFVCPIASGWYIAFRELPAWSGFKLA